MGRPKGYEAKVVRPDPMANKGGKVPVSSNVGPVRPPAGGSRPSQQTAVGPIYGDRPDRTVVEALLHRRINPVLRQYPDHQGQDWRGRYRVEPILRNTSSMQGRHYRVRQWGVWLDTGDMVGYVATTRAGRPKFWPYALSTAEYTIDTETGSGT